MTILAIVTLRHRYSNISEYQVARQFIAYYKATVPN